MSIGVESAHGFGDLIFNLPLIKAIHTKYNDTVWVATRPHCKDALFNIPWIDKIVEIQQMNQGIQLLKNMGCDPVFQITQNVQFFHFVKKDKKHSLINTPLLTGKELGCQDFNNRPIFLPTEKEIENTDSIILDKPTIAIESVYNSGQSWANKKSFDIIVAKYAHTHRILWLSNANAPKLPTIDNMLRFTRRECVMCLRACDILFSVGSGFFCSALALPAHHQPKKIVCLWIDNDYRYEKPLAEYKWHPDIEWIHNPNQLNQCLKRL